MSTLDVAPMERHELKLEKLKRLRDGVNWADEKDRSRAVRRLYEIICNWKERLPDLRQLFPREQLEQLMVDSMNLKCQGKYNFVAKRLVKFVELCGYRDDPDSYAKKTDGLRRQRPVVHRRSTPLHHAAAKNIDYLVPGLFAIYDDYAATYADEHGLTHFHVACRFNRVEVVRAYLDLGRDPNYVARDPEDGHALEGVEPPLHTALLHNCRETAALLMRRGADPSMRNYRGETPLHSVCRRDRRYHADHLLKFFFECVRRLELPAVWVEARDRRGNAPLHLAARNNDARSVRFLLRRARASPIVRNHDQQTAMHLACQMTDADPVEMVELYHGVMDRHRLELASGVDPRDWFGWTPLNYALLNGQERVAELLIERGADPNAPNYRGNFQAGLHILARRHPSQGEQSVRMMNKIYRLTENRPRIDLRDARGNTALLLTLQHGCYRLDMFLALLARGADPNLADFQGTTPLHLICQERNRVLAWNLARLLAIRSRTEVRIDPRDEQDRTPLHYALMRRHEEICRTLLRQGADPNSVSAKDGRTLLHRVCKIRDRRRSCDRARMLLELSQSMGLSERCLQLDARDKWGNTPLHLALIAGNLELAESLLSRGADPNAVNEQGLSALHFISRASKADELARMFFRVCRSEEPARMQLLQCDSRDRKTGDRPLHLALKNGRDWTSRELMTRTWNPQAANDAGLTPLHLICKRRLDDDLIEAYFEACDAESHRLRLRLDPRDAEDRTPLQYAVASLLPRVVEALLRRGADLASFEFPPASYFQQTRRARREENFKLRLATKLMDVIEVLRHGGYELSRADCLTVANLFSTYELYESTDLDENWHEDGLFESIATQLTIPPRRELEKILVEVNTKKATTPFPPKDRSTCSSSESGKILNLKRTCSSAEITAPQKRKTSTGLNSNFIKKPTNASLAYNFLQLEENWEL
ncbi:hypothetical protein TKK_0003748 [Trichogramma kaykai]